MSKSKIEQERRKVESLIGTGDIVATPPGNTVLSASHGQAIVGPRMRLILDNFDAAVAHLHTCTEFSGIAGWMDAAEAAGFWGKMRDDERAIEAAKDFRIHCYREYGILAIKLRGTTRSSRGKGNGSGSIGAAQGWLIENGLKPHEAKEAFNAANFSTQEFERFRKTKQSLSALRASKNKPFNEAVSRTITASQTETAASVAKKVNSNLRENTIKRLRECIQWFTDIESELMKLNSILK